MTMCPPEASLRRCVQGCWPKSRVPCAASWNKPVSTSDFNSSWTLPFSMCTLMSTRFRRVMCSRWDGPSLRTLAARPAFFPPSNYSLLPFYLFALSWPFEQHIIGRKYVWVHQSCCVKCCWVFRFGEKSLWMWLFSKHTCGLSLTFQY